MVLIGVRAVAAVGAGLCSPAAGTGQRQRYPAVTPAAGFCTPRGATTPRPVDSS